MNKSNILKFLNDFDNYNDYSTKILKFINNKGRAPEKDEAWDLGIPIDEMDLVLDLINVKISGGVYERMTLVEKKYYDLSQNYTDASNLGIYKIEAQYFNETVVNLDIANSYIYNDNSTLYITSNILLSTFQAIIVYINFTDGVESDFTQVRLLDNAISNYPDLEWTKNDSIFVTYDYYDFSYQLLYEDNEVDTETSEFMYLDYIRNDKFVVFEQEYDEEYDEFYDYYYIDYNGQFSDFQAFEEVDNTRSVLELKDFDMDGVYEYVVQREDITGDGTYDSAKYGSMDSSGELSFHTSIQRATTTEQFTQKSRDAKNTGKYLLNNMNYIDQFNSIFATGDISSWVEIIENIFEAYDIEAKREIKSETTTYNRIDKDVTIIQKDNDDDGVIDSEIIYEQIFSSVHSTTRTTERTDIYWTLKDVDKYESEGWDFVTDSLYNAHQFIRDAMGELYPKQHEYMKQYLEFQLKETDVDLTFYFRDFVDGELSTTRIYKDTFPNEHSEAYDLENNLAPAYNT